MQESINLLIDQHFTNTTGIAVKNLLLYIRGEAAEQRGGVGHHDQKRCIVMENLHILLAELTTGKPEVWKEKTVAYSFAVFYLIYVLFEPCVFYKELTRQLSVS